MANFLGNRGRKGSLNTPFAVINAPSNRSRVNARQLGPLRHGASRAIECEHAAISTVTALLLIGGPSAVVRLIVAIIVGKPIKRIFRPRSRPYIRNEVLERVPPLADLDPPCPVALVGRGLGVPAPIKHQSPDAILLGSGSSVGDATSTNALNVQTPTALNPSVTQKDAGYIVSLTAVTNANPDSPPVFVSGFMQTYSPQSPKPHPRNILKIRSHVARNYTRSTNGNEVLF